MRHITGNGKDRFESTEFQTFLSKMDTLKKTIQPDIKSLMMITFHSDCGIVKVANTKKV